MFTSFRFPPALALAFAAACGSAATGDYPLSSIGGALTGPSHPATPAAHRLRVSVDTAMPFVGKRLTLMIQATDAAGGPTDGTGTAFVSSNESVARVTGVAPFTFVAINGATLTGLHAFVTLVAPGTAVLEARLGDVTERVPITVRALPPVSTALVVDSFAVVEYRPACARNCPYIAYAPLLRLREPTGSFSASAVALQFTTPAGSTGLCWGNWGFAPGHQSM